VIAVVVVLLVLGGGGVAFVMTKKKGTVGLGGDDNDGFGDLKSAPRVSSGTSQNPLAGGHAGILTDFETEFETPTKVGGGAFKLGSTAQDDV
jgi:hypothetical protein